MLRGNYIHDNNNRDVPGNGLGLVGAGAVVAGGSNDAIVNNRFVNNGAWAVALVPYISSVQNGPTDCTSAGGVWDNPFVDLLAGGSACFFNALGSNVHDNVFIGNGSFSQPTNGDLADLSDFSAIGIPPAAPGQGNCWHSNVDPAGVSSAPPNLEKSNGDCATAPRVPPSPTRFSARSCATCISCPRATRSATERFIRSKTHCSHSCRCRRSRRCPIRGRRFPAPYPGAFPDIIRPELRSSIRAIDYPIRRVPAVHRQDGDTT
jgi:hypothetical protein